MNSDSRAAPGRPFRVVHIITRMIVGGAQENTLLSVCGLRRRYGMDAWLLTGPETGPEGNLLDSPTGGAVPVVTIRSLVRAVSPWRDVCAVAAVWRELRRLRPRLVHTHSGKAGLVGRLAARLAGVPRVIHTLHGSPEFRDASPFPRALFRLAEWILAWLTDDLIGVCRAMVDQGRRMGLRPRRGFAVVPSGFDIEAFTGAAAVPPGGVRRRLGIPPDAYVVAAVARLAPLKGHRDLFRAVGRLAPWAPWLLLIGDGPLREALEAEARSMGLDRRIVWAGLVPPGEVPALLAASDCVAHVSYREGLARVIPQAFLCRKPVVAYALDGTPELVVAGETGWCVPPGDVDALAAALREAASDPARARAFAAEGARRAADRHRADAMIDALARLYRPRHFN